MLTQRELDRFILLERAGQEASYRYERERGAMLAASVPLPGFVGVMISLLGDLGIAVIGAITLMAILG